MGDWTDGEAAADRNAAQRLRTFLRPLLALEHPDCRSSGERDAATAVHRYVRAVDVYAYQLAALHGTACDAADALQHQP